MSGGSGDAFLRGAQLRQLGRLEEAARFFREALARNPDNAEAHLQLALCLDDADATRAEALAAIDRAIALEPEDAFFHAVRSSVLAGLNRGDAALAAASRAVALEPEQAWSHNAVARAQLARQRWADAETAARQALLVDGDDHAAQSVLAVALRMQGKREEDEAAARRLLAENPEDEYAHLNAGWSALRRFEHREAETHFLEALRLRAEFEPARDGLLESFRARSRFYRLYQRWCFWIQKFTAANQWALIIGIFVAYTFGRVLLEALHPAAAGALIVLYLGFAFWVWLAPGIGNFMVYLDRTARHALRPRERLEGLFVGGGFALGVAMLLVGLVASALPFVFAGGAFAAGALPAALVFTNESRAGRNVFGAILAFVYFVGIGAALTVAYGAGPRGYFIHTLTPLALLAVVACTWIGNARSLRR